MSRINTDAQFYVAEDGVPTKSRLEAIDMLNDANLQRVQSIRDQSAVLDALRAAHRNALVDFWGGEKKYQSFRNFLAKERLAFRKQMEPPSGPALSRGELADLREALTQKTDDYLKKRGVDMARFKQINIRFREEFQKHDEPDEMRQQHVVQLVKREDVPKELLAKSTNSWSFKKPPFPGWAWSFSYWTVDNFSANYFRQIEQNTGRLLNQASLINLFDQGDDDEGKIEHVTEIGFWHRKVSAGPIEVWIESEAEEVRHFVSLWNVSGWSDSYVSQKNYLTLRIGSPRHMSKMSWFWEDGYTDGWWNNCYLIGGETYWAHLVTAQSFAANEWVFVFVGQKNWNYASANDVEVNSAMNTIWKIKSVQIR